MKLSSIPSTGVIGNAQGTVNLSFRDSSAAQDPRDKVTSSFQSAASTRSSATDKVFKFLKPCAKLAACVALAGLATGVAVASWKAFYPSVPNPYKTNPDLRKTLDFYPNDSSPRDQLLACNENLMNCEFTGNARILHKNGDVFEGELVQGLRQGKGMLMRGEETYTGDWFNNTRSGSGKMTNPNRFPHILEIDGQWVNGDPMGQVKVVYNNSETYEGQWDVYTPKGQGKATLPNGDVFEGESHTDGYGMLQGSGKYTSVDCAETYDAELVDNQFCIKKPGCEKDCSELRYDIPGRKL